MASIDPAPGQTPWETSAPHHGVEEALSAFSACLGEDALDLCVEVAQRMAEDPDLAERVARRHALLGEHYVEIGAASTLATARADGRRAMLVVLLLESRERFFAT